MTEMPCAVMVCFLFLFAHEDLLPQCSMLFGIVFYKAELHIMFFCYLHFYGFIAAYSISCVYQNFLYTCNGEVKIS